MHLAHSLREIYDAQCPSKPAHDIVRPNTDLLGTIE